ncbi:dihydrofolate reductase family protein [Microbacteriaceae bacterium VKM Ac-2854]|nr:dihydrofolate reductase family protein [Microbacteriaceae bacterium VKM Ac-2854]
MARLIYSAICSLDGFTADADGGFDWSAPDEEVHAFVNDRERRVGTMLLGRRMWEVLRVWDSLPGIEQEPAAIKDYAQLWSEADKIVYSTTLADVDTRRTRLEPVFDPSRVRDVVRASARDVSIGGPQLAAQALRAGLVDEIQLYLNPIIVGGGTAALPPGVRLDLDLVEEHRFAEGVVFLRYRVR